METKNDILKNFKIKPISIKLDKLTFKKIRMRCTATSSEVNEKLTCDIKQELANTFSIKINRHKMDSFLGIYDNSDERTNTFILINKNSNLIVSIDTTLEHAPIVGGSKQITAHVQKISPNNAKVEVRSKRNRRGNSEFTEKGE